MLLRGVSSRYGCSLTCGGATPRSYAASEQLWDKRPAKRPLHEASIINIGSPPRQEHGGWLRVCVQVTGMLGENLVLPDTITQVGAQRAFVDAFAFHRHHNMAVPSTCQSNTRMPNPPQRHPFHWRCTCVPAPVPRS